MPFDPVPNPSPEEIAKNKKLLFQLPAADALKLLPQILPKTLAKKQETEIKKWHNVGCEGMHRAHRAKTRDEAVVWAQFAVQIFDWLISNANNHSNAAALSWTSCGFRIALMQKLGAVTGDPILDPQHVIDWFYQKLPMSLPEFRNLEFGFYYQWSEEKYRAVHALCFRIDLLRDLQEAGLLPDVGDNFAWVAALPKGKRV